ncbi:MAG: energy-coupling factor transporter transmembrane protein EcfT [Halobacteriaceae archaeon]
MTLTYRPGSALAHRLDPRTKLAVQFAFAAAAMAHTTPLGLTVLTVVALGALRAAATPLRTALAAYRPFYPVLALAPLLEGARLSAPWFVPADAVVPALSGYRVVLVLLVGAAYVRSTPVRASRAAIEWVVPGRVGTFLGTGVAFVLRFLPVLRRDLRTIRRATHARLGTERSLVERVRIVGVTGLRRAFRRADGLGLALRARCFSWNPTLPPLAFGRVDALGLALAAALTVAALAPLR